MQSKNGRSRCYEEARKRKVPLDKDTDCSKGKRKRDGKSIGTIVLGEVVRQRETWRWYSRGLGDNGGPGEENVKESGVPFLSRLERGIANGMQKKT